MKYGLEFIAPISGDRLRGGRKPALTIRFDPTGHLNEWKDVRPQLALVDTGADYSLFDEKAVDMTALKPIQNITVDAVQTGLGTLRKTSLYTMSLLLPDDSTIIRLPFIPIDMDTSLPFRIVLGMDFIRHGVLNIDKGSRNGFFDFEAIIN